MDTDVHLIILPTLALLLRIRVFRDFDFFQNFAEMFENCLKSLKFVRKVKDFT